MSKAFTKDEGANAAEPLRRAPIPTSGKRYLTPEGHAALSAELAGLLGERATVSRSGGVDAMTRVAEIDARAALLQAILGEAEVLAPRPDADRAFFGAYVTVEDDQGEQATYRLVGPDEADAKAGRISVESPLGRALLGREAGDEAIVQRPRGPATYQVLAVRGSAP